jgi:hypothetical protein
LLGEVLGINEVNSGIVPGRASKDAANVRMYGDMVVEVPGHL